jgi:hypothetical protein
MPSARHAAPIRHVPVDPWLKCDAVLGCRGLPTQRASARAARQGGSGGGRLHCVKNIDGFDVALRERVRTPSDKSLKFKQNVYFRMCKRLRHAARQVSLLGPSSPNGDHLPAGHEGVLVRRQSECKCGDSLRRAIAARML